MAKRIGYKNLILVLMWFIFIFSKIFHFCFLPAKYFFDSDNYLSYIKYTPKYVDRSIRMTVDVFRKINIFNFTTLIQWAIAITLFFSPIIYLIIKKRADNVNTVKFIFICCSLFLMGLYIFNISKDIIQLTIFLAIYCIIVTKNIKNIHIKILLCAAVFVVESSIFRSYYILAAVFSIVIFYILINITHSNKKITLVKFLGIVFIILANLYVFMLFAQRFMPEEFDDLLTVRLANAHREGSSNAATIILDVFKNDGSINTWMINYIINAVRLMIPVELIFKGLKYIPFVVYQIFVTGYLIIAIKNIGNCEKEVFLSICVFIAFLLTSFMFEPDFGSWVRHETAAFPVYINILNAKSVYQEDIQRQ